MRKIFVLCFLCLLISSFSFAADFVAPVMRVVADASIPYAFGGATLNIPVTIDNGSAMLFFTVFTKDKAEEVVESWAGFRGWHYANRIDTCIFLSDAYNFSAGPQTVTWTGVDDDGNEVPAGTYTYYMLGWDNQITPIHAAPFMGNKENDKIEYNPDGSWRANPIITRRGQKWIIGNDPLNEALEETCSFPSMGDDWSSGGDSRNPIDLNDNSIVYRPYFNSATSTAKLNKYAWNPNGEAVLDTDWDITWSQLNSRIHPAITFDYIFCGEQNYKENVYRTYVHIIDIEAEEYESYIDLTDFYATPYSYSLGGLMNGGTNGNMISMVTGQMGGRSNSSCEQVVWEYMDWWDNPDDTVRWVNQNGDFIMDKNYELTSLIPWVCNITGHPPYTHGWSGDNMGFWVGQASSFGAIDFALFLPDGTGVGHFTKSGSSGSYDSGHQIDTGGAFDGMYAAHTGMDGANFIGYDTITGVITNVTAVEDVPAAVNVVDQNSPNPFNPTTAIAFSLAQAGDVTVEVFNVAGQKIDTLVNGYMDSGRHSVVWDGSGFSAGIYFYTVKSGSFSKTMKMTLLK